MGRGPTVSELTKDQLRKLSGSAYVSARMKQPDSEEDRDIQRIRILRVQNCSHVSDICEQCATTWMQDYNINFTRTAGGRALKARMLAGGFVVDDLSGQWKEMVDNATADAG